jgi:hypothetical protein
LSQFNYSGDPSESGKRAAVDLKGAVQHYLKSVDSGLAGLPIVAKAFASGEGLATLLVKAGVATRGDSHQVLSRFTRGFSQADMFDFVLVGKGKDRADHKLMGMALVPTLFPMLTRETRLILVNRPAAFHQFVESPSCRHVLLACCHDSGYVRMLEKCVHNSTIVQKVTLVKSFQTGGEFEGLPFHATTMDTVFRSNPLGHRPGSASGATNFESDELAVQVNASPALSTPPVSRTITYASRAAASQKPAVSSTLNPRPLPVFGTLDKNLILINEDGHRIDMLLPPKSATVFDAFQRKTHDGGKRFCNMYHLYGVCAGNCGYLHDPLTAGEKLVMRHKLRAQKCHDRGECRDPLCFYGHHCSCPWMGKKCSFPLAMHGVDVGSWREVNGGSRA